MPAFSSVSPALSSLAPTSASTVSPAFSQPSASSASSYLPTSSALSQPASSTSSLPPHPSLNHIVLALRGNVTTKPTPGTSTTPSLISSTASPSSGPSSRKWLPGVIVAAVVVVVAAALLAFWLTFRRRRRQRYEQARQHDPQLTPDQFRRRSHMSQAALAAEAERERRNIIRKSLISRSSGSLSYLGAAGEVAGLDHPVGADEMEEESYRGVPLYQRQPVPRPPLQPQPAQPTHPDMEREFYESDRLQEYADLGAPPPPPPAATAPLVPAPLNVAAAAPAPAVNNLRDDYKEWAASLRRHTSRVADRHPSLAEVVEESESDQREPLVGDRNNNRPASPPIPPRSRLRPLSMVALPDVANVGFGSGVPPRQDSTASHTGGFMTRQVHEDPRNRGQPDAASPTSLYSVDFSQVGMGGRRNSAGR